MSMKKRSKIRTVRLKTPFESSVTETPFEIHPRQQMKRSGYMSLNGKWTLSVIRGGENVYSGEVTVPYPPESEISGVNRQTGRDDMLIYEKRFTVPENFSGKRVILHIDAVDQTCEVFVNSRRAGEARLPYLPNSFEITEHITEGENNLTVTVSDALDTDLPYGKQTARRGGMWYTAVSGIWQSVWLEAVPEEYIKELKLTPSLDRIRLELVGGAEQKRLFIRTPGGLSEHEFTGDSCEIVIDEPRLWSPEDPYLYRFTLRCGEDEIESYFALRTFGITEADGVSYLALNGKPYFLHGLLDQGYYSDGIFTPATPEGYENDILKMKSCGFNMLRKHIKLEPDIFYYYCDKHGMILWQDMINNGKYSFILDTALPTVGIKRGLGT